MKKNVFFSFLVFYSTLTLALAAGPSEGANPPSHFDSETARIAKLHQDRAHFASEIKVIDTTLRRAVKILEGNYGGTDKLPIAAQLFQDLIEIHREYPLGSEKRRAALESLAERAAEQKAELKKNHQKLPIEHVDSLISALESEQKLDSKIIQVLRDYYLVKKAYLTAVGLKVGAALVGFGGETGPAFGVETDALGRKRTAFCWASSGSAYCGGVGPAVMGTLFRGEIQDGYAHLNGDAFGLGLGMGGYSGIGTGINGVVIDVGVCGIRETMLGACATMNVIGHPFKLGFNFESLRARLGIVSP